MYAQVDKAKENKSSAVANAIAQKKSDRKPTFQFLDNRPEAGAQRKLQEMANNSPQVKQAAQLQAMAKYASNQQQRVQKKENKTGFPDNLKSVVENISGYSLDDVKVHYNSDKPAQLQAHAYAQGTGIHIVTGQEKHLPHEAWHVVQQKQGRVKPTIQMKDGVSVNDNKGLEKEADKMGEQIKRQAKSENNVNVGPKERELLLGHVARKAPHQLWSKEMTEEQRARIPFIKLWLETYYPQETLQVFSTRFNTTDDAQLWIILNGYKDDPQGLPPRKPDKHGEIWKRDPIKSEYEVGKLRVLDGNPGSEKDPIERAVEVTDLTGCTAISITAYTKIGTQKPDRGWVIHLGGTERNKPDRGTIKKWIEANHKQIEWIGIYSVITKCDSVSGMSGGLGNDHPDIFMKPISSLCAEKEVKLKTKTEYVTTAMRGKQKYKANVTFKGGFEGMHNAKLTQLKNS